MKYASLQNLNATMQNLRTTMFAKFENHELDRFRGAKQDFATITQNLGAMAQNLSAMAQDLSAMAQNFGAMTGAPESRTEQPKNRLGTRPKELPLGSRLERSPALRPPKAGELEVTNYFSHF